MASFWETIQVDGADMHAYASVPSNMGSGPFPAVIVSQHGGGVDHFIRDMCDALAQAGFAAVAPNLFHRFNEEQLDNRTGRIQHLSDPEIVADISATVNWLRDHSAIQGDKIGITGFCMGGRVAWLGAATNRHIKACVPYYGGNIFVTWGAGEQTPFELASGINSPVLFHFGEIDENPSAADRDRLDAELTRLGVAHEFHTYEGADHAFMDYTGLRHQREASEASWPRTIEFFTTHLMG